MNEMEEKILKEKIEGLFVKQETDLTLPNTLGALITAASKMASPSEIVDEHTSIDELINLYNASEETKNLIGMSPQFVKANIGYSVDFQDYNAAATAYNVDKENYDELYHMILNRSEERASGREM